MKNNYIYLDSTPYVKWFSWDNIDRLKNKSHNIPMLDLSEYCLVYCPSAYRIYSMYFNFSTMQWQSDHNKEEVLEMYEISHWAFLPELPKEWEGDCDNLLMTTSEWILGQEERKNRAKQIKKGI